MAEALPHSPHQQRIEELSSASVRALANDARLHYRDRLLYCENKPVPVRAPHLRVDVTQRDVSTLRGISDALALRLRHSCPRLHAQNSPTEPVPRLVFELLEQLRVETLAPPEMPGMVHNLHQRFTEWAAGFHRSGLTDSSLGILLYTVVQMCWSRLNAQAVLAETEDFIEATRAGIAPMIGHALAGLRRHRGDQEAYAVFALEVAHYVHTAVHTLPKESTDDGPVVDTAVQNSFALLLNFDEEEIPAMEAVATGTSKAFSDANSIYRIYTTEYDTETRAATLVRKALLKEYRQDMDALIGRQGVSRSRLARLLSASLATPSRDGWKYGEEEGYIDGRRLTTLLASPNERRLFTQERYFPRADCLVTFLVDCSGSMKEHSLSVAVMLDILVRHLEQLGASTELLGFTTGAWNGGRAYKDWLRRGRPAFPGRLNEVAYRIFKSADRTWRGARHDIAALLKPDLFREGIDGEAIQWAASRMLARDERRRILVVVSDGCPMDVATKLTNDEFYLDNHLRQVVYEYERSSPLEILGIGLGLDLSSFYRNSLAIDLTQGLQNETLYDIARLFRPQRLRLR